jgi:hypothetical protein
MRLQSYSHLEDDELLRVCDEHFGNSLITELAKRFEVVLEDLVRAESANYAHESRIEDLETEIEDLQQQLAKVTL